MKRLLLACLTLADFGANSLNTLILATMSARLLSVGGFGSYGVATQLALFGQAIAQGGLIDVVMREAQNQRPEGYWSIERLFPIAILLAGVGLFLGAVASPLWYVLCGFAILFLYVRSFWVRAYLVADGRSHESAIRSLASLGIAVAGLALTTSQDLHGWLPVLAVHIAAYTLPTMRVHLKLRTHRHRAGETRYWNIGYAIENLILMGALQLSSVVATPFLGLGFSAGLRGASIVMGPLSVIFSGTRMLLMPWLAQRGRQLRYPLIASGAMAAMCTLWYFAALFVSAHWGDALMGETAPVAHHYMPWVGLTYITQGTYMVLFVAGRAYLADFAVRHARTVEVSIVVIGTLLAIILRSPTTYFAMNSLSMVLAFLVLTHLLRRNIARPRRALPE